MYSKELLEPKRIAHLSTFGDIGATIADNFNVTLPNIGTSFLNELK